MDATLTDITDAQAAEIMLTLPWNFGDLNEDGEACYSDGEIQSVIKYVRKINARAEAAEAALAQCQQERDSLREQVAALAAEIERLHVGLSKLQDGMPDYLDCAVQDLIDGAA